MAKYYYNGVLLPEIPADVLAEYPYCWIRKNADDVTYDLLCGKYEWYDNNVNSLFIEKSTYVWYTAELVSDSFTYKTSYTDDGNIGFGNGLVWANHDIVYRAFNTLILQGTLPISTDYEGDFTWYQIKDTTLKKIGNEARRISGKTNTETLTLEQMILIFQKVSASS